MAEKKGTLGEQRSREIDWGAVHRRLEAVRTTVERGWTPTVEEKKRILQARAKALAQEPAREEAAQEALEVVEFLLAYERYGIESSYVREVYPLKELTPLPGTPSFVLGIINERGQILSVIDLKKFFDLPEKGLTDLNRVIIVRNDHMEFGILADTILGVRAIPFTDLQPSLPTLTGIREEYLKGVTGERVVILDAEKLLSDKKMIVQEEVEA
jgi:purine-binding chemotaxis protein CheW